MKHKSVLELTPLVDIFLILVFGLTIHYEGKQDGYAFSLEVARQEAATAELTIREQETELARYKASLNRSASQVLAYEKQLEEQKALMDQAMLALAGKMGQFLGATALELEAQANNGTLRQEDYRNFLNTIDKLVPDNAQGMLERVYVLAELQAYATVVSVYLNDSSQLLIDKKQTGIRLRGFDEQLGAYPPGEQARFQEQLKTALENHYEAEKRGEQKLGEVVLFTFGHASGAVRTAIRLAQTTVSGVHKETALREGYARKVFYADLGYYPF